MPNERNESDVRPAAGDHAIVQVSFGFEWDEPLSQEQFDLLSLFHKVVQEQLPRKREVRAGFDVTVLAGEAPDEAEPSEPRTMTIVMDALNPDGSVKQKLEILEKRIVFKNYSKYTDWASEQKCAMEVLNSFTKIIAAERPVSALGIEYIDAFELDSLSGFQESVFSSDSDIVPRHVFNRNDLWHVHQGYFGPREEGKPYRVLTLVNIHVIADERSKRLEISGNHRAVFDGPVKDLDQVDVFEIQKQLHEDNKSVLRNILTPEIRKMINLDRNSEAGNG